MKKIILSQIFCCGLLSAQTIIPQNGIRLPEVWPPRQEEPTERKEMDIPYLRVKPDVIPINTGRQMFVDNFLISQTDLKRVIHEPNFYKNNPVLAPDREWEKTKEGALYAAPFSDGVWFDEKDNKFKMWYLAGAGKLHKDNQTFYTCYAESLDGKKWEKPVLDIVPHTNVVETTDRDAATVWLDRNEPDPNKRWKLFNIERRLTDKRWQFVLKYSADGKKWSKGVAQSGDVYDRSSAFYNPFLKKWVLSMRYGTEISSRSRAYLENSDPEMAVSLAHRIRKDAVDKNIVFWFTPDDKELKHEKFPDVKPGIYNFDAIPYESLMLGFYSAWSGPENKDCEKLGIQKRNQVSLGYSRDGFHFYRPTHQPFMKVNETEGSWNWGNMQSVNGVPIIVGDSLYFYSSGRKLNKIMWDSNMSTGLAMLRRDGFVSMNADREVGTLTTENVRFDGKYFFVNADVKKGELQVEILDEKNTPIKGFDKKNCNPMKKIDDTKYQITWKGNNDLSSLIHQVVRFRFYLENGDLYSFWVSPWETGESRGYTAGGGPGLSPTGIDVPVND